MALLLYWHAWHVLVLLISWVSTITAIGVTPLQCSAPLWQVVPPEIAQSTWNADHRWTGKELGQVTTPSLALWERQKDSKSFLNGFQLANLVKVQNTCLKSLTQHSRLFFCLYSLSTSPVLHHIPMWAVLATQWPLLPLRPVYYQFKFKVGKNCTWEWIIHFILFCHVLTASLSSPWQVTEIN